MTSIISIESNVKTFKKPDWLQACILKDQNLGDQANTEDNNLICRAFLFADELHEGQVRKSGEPYIAHPVAVAGLLRDLGGDSTMIAAGFLHDVVEDTEVTLEEIEEKFGLTTRQLVEGVTKLSKFNFSSKTESQAENFRRMFLAMAKDIRVIVVKLADRLHNMRTLEYLKPEKQKRIALETREIFAPLANRLGMWRFKWELEDLCFKYLEPAAYREIQEFVSEKRVDRETRLEKVTQILRDRFTEIGVPILEIKGRPKHLYGIYQKMQRHKKEFKDIYDLAGLRIIVEQNEECYRALAIVHDSFTPIPGRFKDYIGLPKPNGYQSLHTAVVGLNGRPLEVQIRTMEMHQIAEYGIAAHWKYKESGSSNNLLKPDDEKYNWLRRLLECQTEIKDSQEFFDNVRFDFQYDDDVHVFTPQGEVIVLARGSTPVDFAYRIHTEVGNHIKGAKINDRWLPLNTHLHNGDIVEIITSENSHPSPDWLNFVKTTTARQRIRQWCKRSYREENIIRGRDMLEKELGKKGLQALLKSSSMQTAVELCNYQKVDDLLAALGYGEITITQIINRLREVGKLHQAESPEIDPEITSIPAVRDSARTYDGKSPITGIEGLLHYIAGCCKPIPDEAIIGVVTRNARGIAIHSQECHNLETVPGERLIPVNWNLNSKNGQVATYPVDIQIEVLDRVGVFKDILARLSDYNINVSSAGVKSLENKKAIISLTIDIRDRRQYEECINTKVRNMSDVLNIRRV